MRLGLDGESFFFKKRFRWRVGDGRPPPARVQAQKVRTRRTDWRTDAKRLLILNPVGNWVNARPDLLNCSCCMIGELPIPQGTAGRTHKY